MEDCGSSAILQYAKEAPAIRGRSICVVVVRKDDLQPVVSHGPADSCDHLGGVSPVGVPALCVPAGEVNVILGVKIAAEPRLSLGFFLLQLTEQSGAVFSPEAVIVDVFVVGRKQGAWRLPGPCPRWRSPAP